MGIGSIAGRVAGLLGRNVTRFGRLNPLVTIGLTGATLGGVLYKHKRDEKNIEEIVEEEFSAEIRERGLWEDIRSQIAGASDHLFKTFVVYRTGERTPTIHRKHTYRTGKDETVQSVKDPGLAEAHDLVAAAMDTLHQSRVNDLPMYRDRGTDRVEPLLKDFQKVRTRLARAKNGEVKKPDHAGIQAQLDGLLATHVKPVLSDLSYVIGQGTIRIRGDYRKGLYKRTGVPRK